MTEKEILFVASDLHGHAAAFRAALAEAGYDPQNPTHRVVLLGDLFDRGNQNRAVLRLLRELPRLTIVRGNHEDILARVLAAARLDSEAIANGTLETVSEFFGEENIDAAGRIRMAASPRERLESYLAATQEHFETAHYHFVHGWLPLTADADGKPRVASLDSVTKSDWEAARTLGWYRAVGWALFPADGKTVVCGHRSAHYGSRFDPSREEGDSRPYRGKGVIAVDALTVVSGRVNVLVLEDEVPIPQTHTVPLSEDAFDRTVIGEKTVAFFPEREPGAPIAVGDRLRFTTRKGRTLTVSVTGRYRYPDTETLCEDFSLVSLGFGPYAYEFPQNAPLYRRFRDADGIVAVAFCRR